MKQSIKRTTEQQKILLTPANPVGIKRLIITSLREFTRFTTNIINKHLADARLKIKNKKRVKSS